MVKPKGSNTMDSVILNAVQVDYLRLTSFDIDTFSYIEEVLNQLQEEQCLKKGSEDCRLMQYEGYRVPSLKLFIGKGKQTRAKGEPKQWHYMLDLAGSFAHDMHLALHRLRLEQYFEFKVPRIDIQISITEGRFKTLFWDTPQVMFERLVRSDKDEWFGPKPRLEYTSDLSLGIGNRRSGLYRRIYRKDTVEPVAIRFESEFHNDMARQVFVGNVEGLFGKSWMNFPKRYNTALLAAPADIEWSRIKTSAESRINWLNSTIFPMLLKDMHRYDVQNGTRLSESVGGLQRVIEKAYYALDKIAEE